MKETPSYNEEDARMQYAILLGTFTASVAGYLTSAFPHTRSHPAELWNYFDHAGNTLTVAYGYMAASVGAVRSRLPERPFRRAVAGGAIGLIMSLSLNACFETEIGNDLIGKRIAAQINLGGHNTSDTGDLIWGSGAGVLGGALIAARRRAKRAEPASSPKGHQSLPDK